MAMKEEELEIYKNLDLYNMRIKAAMIVSQLEIHPD